MRNLKALALAATLAFTLGACSAHPHLLPSTSYRPDSASQTVGERWFRMELSSGQRIGYMHLSVKAAPKGSKAAYAVTTQGLFAMGPVEMSITEESLLDASFSAVSVTSEKNGQMPDKPASKESTSLVRTKDGWDRNLEGKDDHSPLDVPYFDVTPGLTLLVERLPLADKTTWTLPSLAWTDRMTGEQAKARTITLEVRAAKFQHAGAEVEGFTVNAKKDDKEGEDVLYVDASGRLLRLTTSDAPIRLIATDEATAKTEEAPEAIDPSAPQYPLLRYLEVLAGVADAEVLDAVLDWDAVLTGMAEKLGGSPPPPEARDETIASIKAELHGQAAGKLDANMIRLAVGMTTVRLEGDRAYLSGPGGGAQVFIAEKRGEGWVLIELPR